MINTINPPKKKAANIQVDKLRTFEEHPFKVLDDEDRAGFHTGQTDGGFSKNRRGLQYIQRSFWGILMDREQSLSIFIVCDFSNRPLDKAHKVYYNKFIQRHGREE